MTKACFIVQMPVDVQTLSSVLMEDAYHGMHDVMGSKIVQDVMMKMKQCASGHHLRLAIVRLESCLPTFHIKVDVKCTVPHRVVDIALAVSKIHETKCMQLFVYHVV